uniref:Uncharacterized protein n=1 Tax=Desertifilum tharense IPPAS B-1220 TaxID=1781255 RepID=A0A1E5QQQ2_9CYAN|nr:hypothetical protein BH720_01810 [Desertifilum tharense IPPAS B-1220]
MVGVVDDGQIHREEGSWELGVGGWGRRGWGDGEMGRWGEEGSWELGVGEEEGGGWGDGEG